MDQMQSHLHISLGTGTRQDLGAQELNELRELNAQLIERAAKEHGRSCTMFHMWRAAAAGPGVASIRVNVCELP